jgi:hypothetical protein
MPATASGSFGSVQLPDWNFLLDTADGKTTADVARTQIGNEGGKLANQLASATLGSNTQIAANAAEGGSLANQYAGQKYPLDITILKQQAGQESSPVFDRLLSVVNGGVPGPQSSADIAPSLASRESGGDPSAVNAGGYSGMFQQGAARLSDPGIGVYTPAKGEDVNANTWNGTFSIPGFPEVKTHADFLKSPGAQRAALAAEVANTNQAISATPGADKFSPSGLQAVAHLGGVAGMQKFVATGGSYNPADSNGTKLSDYYNHFAQGGPAALQATFGHPDGPPQPAAAPGVTVAPAPVAAVPAPAPVQVATRGPIAGDTASDAVPSGAAQPPAPGFDAAGNPLPAGSWDASSVSPPAAAQGVDAVLTRLRAGQPQIQNPNALLSVAAPDGSVAQPAPNALAGYAVPAPGQPQPPQAPPAAQPGTGMNSPQVQQAQGLMRQAAQIEMIAAQAPNDPRVKALAAAKAAELRGQAQVLMQADSVVVDPRTGLQTHTLTGKVDSAATPAMDYKPDPNNPGVLVSPGQKPIVIPPGRATTLPDGSTWVTGPGGTFKEARGPNLEGATAAATAAAGGTAAAKAAAETKDRLVPLARTSIQAISNIDYGLHQLDEAAKGGIPTGYFAPALATAASAAKSLGIKIPGVDPSAVSNIQTASKTLAVVSGAILQNILGPKAEITEGKIEAFIHAQPGIVNDPLATHRILNWARSQFTYDHEMAMDGLKNVDPKSGLLSPGWEAGYITSHGSGPIYDPISGEMKQPDGQAPSREPPVEAAAKPAPVAPATPRVGAIMQGHTFLGGDPSSPASWRPIAAPAAPRPANAPHAELN